MRSAIRVLLVLSTALLCVSTAAALEFTAVADGGWKDPATWGRTGYVRDGDIPGMLDGRFDSVIIPVGFTVYYEGDYLPLIPVGGKSGRGLTTIEVYGHVRGKSSKSRIKLKATEDINVQPTGRVGGSATSNPSNPVTIQADSNVTVQGKVEGKGKGGTVEIKAGKDITINGQPPSVVSDKRYVDVKSKGGKVVVAQGDSVKAGTSVRLQAGKGKDVEVQGVVQAGKNIHINKDYYSGQCGNVVIGPQGALLAPNGEVKIKADTLRVQGRIVGRTVQKTVKVLIIEGDGSIEAKKKSTNKALVKWEAEQRRKQEAAEWAEKMKVIGTDFCPIDMSNADGTILGALESINVAGGPGAILDLTGNPPGIPVIECDGPIEIHVDDVLLDPGVLIEDLCGPGPVMLAPSGPTFDPVCIADSDTVAFPGIPFEIRFKVENMGNDFEVFEVMLEDSLDWEPPTGWTPLPLGGHHDPPETTHIFLYIPPPTALADVDTNKITMTVRSTTDPALEYVETAIVPVLDISELMDVHAGLWGINAAPGGAVMGIEHWLTNNGELDDNYLVTVWNQEGWPMPPLPPDVLIPAGEEFLLMSDLEIPPGTPDGFPNEVYLMVESLTSPGVSYTDTIGILVNVVANTGPDLPPAGGIRHEAHPNPFNPKVTIAFSVPTAGDRAVVTVYDVNGRRVRRVFEGPVGPAGGTCVWDGTDAAGRRVSSGVYVYRIETGSLTATGKVVLAK